MSIKNWSELLKDVPTEALISEIEMRKSNKSTSNGEANDNWFQTTFKSAMIIMNETDKAIKKYGEYSFDDKGPWEVMNFDSIIKDLKEKSVTEIANILSEVLDNYPNYNRVSSVVSCIISELDYLPEDEFEQLLSSDKRFEY